MKFEFYNLGAIDEASVELSPLTIVCGKNNTGKTYVSYAIYALLSNWFRLFEWKAEANEVKRLREHGSISINLIEKVSTHWDEIREETVKRWLDFLPLALAAPLTRFAETTLSFDVGLDERWIERSYAKEYRSEKGRVLFSASKSKGSPILEFVAVMDEEGDVAPGYFMDGFIKQTVLEAVFSLYLPQVFMVSSERTGAVTFREELNLTKNRLVNLLAKTEKGKDAIDPGDLFAAVYRGGYPLPVENNVQFVNRFGSLESRIGPLATERPDLLLAFESIVGGRFETNRDGVTHFIPAGSKTKLQLSEASSSARSLVLVWYWLRAEAASGSMLLIDEPEMNLHPENQRAFARFIAKLVNSGVRVFITTHSDTIVREINTLLMLSRNLDHFTKIKADNHYEESEILGIEKVRLYIAHGRERTKANRAKKGAKATLIEVLPDPTMGLAADIFDETIQSMAEIQDAIRYGAE
jgi:hypothetical protein